MEQGLKSRVAIVGGGPAGCICAYFLKKSGLSPVVFEKNSPLRTLLPTGGGRCNLAHSEFDLRELAANYPRGEKFLYSVFSKFGTAETLAFFEEIGIPTYVQPDCRIFPVSDSAKEVRQAVLNSLSGVKFLNENVLKIKQCDGGFEVKTDKASYFFEKVVVSIGGHSAFEVLGDLGHKIVTPCPALTGLKCEADLSELAGVAIKNVCASFKKTVLQDDLLFTHEGVSGPLVYKISSLMAREDFPYKISFNFVGALDFQKILNENSKKNIENILSEFVPKSFARYVLKILKIDENKKAFGINGKVRDLILQTLTNFEMTVTGASKGTEVVTCGGVLLDEVNSKTMESKLVKGLYFCGEVLDIDGFCGGFNLQNCWSTGYVASQGVLAD